MSTLEEAISDGCVCVAPPANNILLPAVAAQTYSRGMESVPKEISCCSFVIGGAKDDTGLSLLQDVKLTNSVTAINVIKGVTFLMILKFTTVAVFQRQW